MFEFFFKYPLASFLKGHFVLLGRWPGWVLVLLIVACTGGLGWLMWSRRMQAAPKLRGWRGVAICHNMHLGDAWEWADDPEYPEQFASMAFRVGLNYVMYSMTH